MTFDIENTRLITFLKDSQHCEVIYHFMDELLVATATTDQPKDLLVYKTLDNLFKNIDLRRSFSKKLIIFYGEVLLPENLRQLHSWMLTQSCNIKNIILIPILHVGIYDWYEKYINLMGEPGMTMIEAPWLYTTPYKVIQQSMPKLDKDSVRKNLKYYFSFWGGTSPQLDRDFLVSIFSTVPNGVVDYVGYGSSDQMFENYLEQITYFMDKTTVDKLVGVKQTKNKFSGTADKQIGILDQSTFQLEVDRASALIPIRETLNDIVYSTVTEKTIKAFTHMLIPLPISGVGTIDRLSELGFKFYDIVDYNSFQHEKIFYKRVMLIVDEMLRIQQMYSLTDLEEYILDNKETFYYNYEFIQQGRLAEQSAMKIIKCLSN